VRFLCLLVLLPLFPFAGCGSSDTPEITAPQCDDLAVDGTETDVDCGGSECPACPANKHCLVDADCETGNCANNFCRPPGPAPTCTDGVMNGEETDVDCGGHDCPACDTGGVCVLGTDCVSGLCTNGKCDAPAASCTDGAQNGDETDVDCGGSCPPCADGLVCAMDADCASMICASLICVDESGACMDGARDGNETDVDCGGGLCAPCGPGSACNVAGDCMSGLCTNDVCM
jgi:hypothetical protein